MRRVLLIGALVLALLVAFVPSAQAAPRYGQRWTSRNGWIVYVRGDWAPSRVRCSWWAGGRWTTNWYVPAYDYKWTTSDAGNYGNRRPQNLRCTYVRL